MGFWDMATGVWETFVEVIPRPVKIIIFILLLDVLISVLITMFLSPFITCDGNSAYVFKDMNDKLKFEADNIQWSSCKSESVYQQTKGLNITAYGVKVGVISGMLNMVYDVMNYLTHFWTDPANTISMMFNKNDDPCLLQYTKVDSTTGENINSTLNLSTIKSYRELIIADNGKRICDKSDKNDEIVCAGCKNGSPRLLLFERLDVFDFKLWLLLIVLSFVGMYSINKIQYQN